MTSWCRQGHLSVKTDISCVNRWRFISRQNLIDDPGLRDARDSLIEPVPRIGEFLVVKPEEVENGGMPVLDTHRFIGDRESKIIC